VPRGTAGGGRRAGAAVAGQRRLYSSASSASSARHLQISAHSPLTPEDVRIIAQEPTKYAEGAEILDSIVKVRR
jgi:hypothetical protein